MQVVPFGGLNTRKTKFYTMLKIKQVILLVIFSFFFTLLNTGFSQEVEEEKQNLTAHDVQQAFEKALRSIDINKQKEQEALIGDLRAKLNLAVDDYIAKISGKRELELRKAIKQNWEELSKYGPYIHYDYYLRDYAYVDIKTDIISTGSLNTPYKAYLTTTEKLFVEREHAPSVSSREKFFYTAVTPIKVDFSYHGGECAEDNAEYEQTSLNQGWPQEVISKLKLFK